MGESLLKRIQDTVVKYADIISSVINVDVEIVDNKLNRIAGTGCYKGKNNEDISNQGYVYKYVLNTGEYKIVERPGKDELCRECEFKHKCVELMQICTPIIFNNIIIGVIALICFNEDQKKAVLKNINSHLQFINQISDFISTKIYEDLDNERNEKFTEILKHIIDTLGKGIIALNENNHIVLINDMASKVLNLEKSSLGKKIGIEYFESYSSTEDTFNITVDNKEVKLNGELIPVYPMVHNFDKIFIFSEERKPAAINNKTKTVSNTITLDNIVGESYPMLLLKDRIKKIAKSNSTVFITGESGTGKEVIARAIHAESDRSHKPFIAINCAAIPESLLESELFGYIRGAFSGANPNGRIGKFELANEGVIFLDEIGDMPLYLQVKILRVIQERKLVRIGSNQLVDLNIRVIAATNKDIPKLIKENKFREDLYYRLNVIPLELPPLRDRENDLELIAIRLLDRYNFQLGKNVNGIDKDVLDVFRIYRWPGNIRELENTIEFMVNLVDYGGNLTRDTIPGAIIKSVMGEENSQIEVIKVENNFHIKEDDIKPLKEIELDYINKILDICGHDTKGKQEAAKKLGIGIATLYRKIGENK
ncbi:sigma-54 interaction domain-containing protein [Clostridium sp.]|uniref:sigma-54 interaction domain-containing protein n=1 Tax=Clostridium sp. TaxID=1506 RepID=UPI00346462B2